MLMLLIDTNVLLQCHPIANLDWLSLSPAGVRVVIPVAALAEIDRAKASGNTRRAKKARDVSAMFSAALDVGAERTAIPGRPNCSWEFASGQKAWHDSLDRDLADHRLIAEALLLAAGGESVAFMTDDTLARLSAMRAGLRVIKVPNAWLLAPEPDGRDKRLHALESRVAAMEKATPKIVVAVERADVRISSLHHAFEFLDRPSEHALDELKEMLQRRHPRATSIREIGAGRSSTMLGMRLEVPTDEQFRAYQDVHYPHWLERSRKALVSLAERMSRRNRVVRIALVIENTGTVPAHGLLLEYQVHGGAQLLPKYDKDREQVFLLPTLPSAPKPPEARLIHPFEQLTTGPYISTPDIEIEPSRAHRDPHWFYWREVVTELGNRHAFECEEFRHGRAESLEVEIMFPATGASKGALVCELSARNMPPVKHVVALTHTGDAIDATSKLREVVDPPATLRLRLPPNKE